MAESSFSYVSYIRTTPEELWAALTDTGFMQQYWFDMRCESQWTTGSPWRIVSGSGEVYDTGEIAEATPPRRLVIRWQHQHMPELKAEGLSTCTMDLEPKDGATKLTITHSIEREASKLIAAVSEGWPQIVSNLKSLMETGTIAM